MVQEGTDLQGNPRKIQLPIPMETVYFGDAKGHFYAYDAHLGYLVFQSTFAYSITCAPAVSSDGEIVYFGHGGDSADPKVKNKDNFGRIVAVRAGLGTTLFTYDLQGAPASAPVITEGILYIGSHDGNLYAIDTVARNEMFRFKTGGKITSPAIVLNGVVYVGSSDSSVYAIDGRIGSLVFKYTAGAAINTRPAFANGVLYFGSDDKALHAIEGDTGKHIFKYATSGAVRSSPIIYNGVVFFGDTAGSMHSVMAATHTYVSCPCCAFVV